MTDLAFSRNCFLPQLPVVAAARSQSLPRVSFEKNSGKGQHDNFIILSKSGSCRNPNICVCVNDTKSQAFVHKASVSRTCNEQSFVDSDRKHLEYFSLLKEYTCLVVTIKSLINELESITEGQHGDDEEQTMCGRSQWDLSKVLNILERYRSDIKRIRRLKLRLRSFLKSEMPFLSQTIGLNLQGLFNFVKCAESDMMHNVYMIINKGLLNLHSCNVDELLKKDSLWKINCISLLQLASKFEKIASEAINDFENWMHSWRHRVTQFVSRKGGIRSQFPLLYFRNLSQPSMLFHLKDFLVAVGINECVSNVTQARAMHISNHITGLLYNLLFGDNCHSIAIQGQESYDSNEKKISNSSPEDKNAMKQKSKRILSASLKRIRHQFFQEFRGLGHKEELLISEFITAVLKPNFKYLQAKELSLNGRNNHQTLMTENSPVLNGIVGTAGNNSSLNTSKKVHWGDMTDSNTNKEIVDIHLSKLWQTLSEHFITQLANKFIQVNVMDPKWDYSLTSMDLGRARLVLSCLSVKKLRSDSVEKISPDFSQCARSISASTLFLISMQRWDQVIKKAQVSAFKDKCRIAPNSQQPSETMCLIVEALSHIHSIYELLASNRGSDMRYLANSGEHGRNHIISLSLMFLHVTLRTAIDWLQSKSQQFISSGSWEQYHIITSRDADALQETLRLVIPHYISLTKKVHLMEEPNTILLGILEATQNMFSKIKAIVSGKIDALVSNIRSRSQRAIEQHFPEAKFWRKKGSTRMPFEPNMYVRIAPGNVLLPVVESVKLIDKELAEQILSKCFTVFLSSLMEFILEEGIRFSFYGAHQLRFDFTSFKDWLSHDSLHLSSSTVSGILSSDVFMEFGAGITLLCCQPEGRRRSNAGSDSDNASSLGSSTSQGSYNGSFYETTIREIELRNKEQWLALRMKGGQNKSKLLCITPS